MKRPNAMLRKIEADAEMKYRAEFLAKVNTLRQMCTDAAFMAAADVFQMGPGRCEAFGNATMEALNEIAALVNGDYADDRDLVYAKEKVDQRLRVICGDKFEPWEVRYETD